MISVLTGSLFFFFSYPPFLFCLSSLPQFPFSCDDLRSHGQPFLFLFLSSFPLLSLLSPCFSAPFSPRLALFPSPSLFCALPQFPSSSLRLHFPSPSLSSFVSLPQFHAFLMSSAFPFLSLFSFLPLFRWLLPSFLSPYEFFSLRLFLSASPLNARWCGRWSPPPCSWFLAYPLLLHRLGCLWRAAAAPCLLGEDRRRQQCEE